MNEEIKNEVVDEVVENQIENTGNGIVGKAVVGGLIVLAGVGAWLYKKRKKRQAEVDEELAKYLNDEDDDFDGEDAVDKK